jgi:hypothetical protein
MLGCRDGPCPEEMCDHVAYVVIDFVFENEFLERYATVHRLEQGGNTAVRVKQDGLPFCTIHNRRAVVGIVPDERGKTRAKTRREPL